MEKIIHKNHWWKTSRSSNSLACLILLSSIFWMEAKSFAAEARETELRKAVEKCDVSSVKRLLENGVSAKKAGDGGQTILHLAVKKDCVEVARVLLAMGELEINAKDGNGNTPLHMAAEKQSGAMLALLAENGADLYLMNKKGKSTLNILNQKGLNALREEMEKGRAAWAWGQAKARNTTDAYSNFISIYSPFPQAKLAKAALDGLDTEAWKAVSVGGREVDYRKYLAEWPAGLHIGEAKKALEQFSWERVVSANTIAGYRSFLAKCASGEFPGEHKVDANKRMEELWNAMSPLGGEKLRCFETRVIQLAAPFSLDEAARDCLRPPRPPDPAPSPPQYATQRYGYYTTYQPVYSPPPRNMDDTGADYISMSSTTSSSGNEQVTIVKENGRKVVQRKRSNVSMTSNSAGTVFSSSLSLDRPDGSSDIIPFAGLSISAAGDELKGVYEKRNGKWYFLGEQAIDKKE